MTGIVVIEDVTGDVSLLEVDGASGVTVGPVVVTIVVNASVIFEGAVFFVVVSAVVAFTGVVTSPVENSGDVCVVAPDVVI